MSFGTGSWCVRHEPFSLGKFIVKDKFKIPGADLFWVKKYPSSMIYPVYYVLC